MGHGDGGRVITTVAVGVVTWLVVSVAVGVAVGKWLQRRDETPAQMEVRTPQGRQKGILWVDGEPTMRYKIRPAFPRHFLN